MTNQFLEDMNHMEKLEAVVHERTLELMLYKAFLRDKGLEEEFMERLAEAKEKTNAAD